MDPASWLLFLCASMFFGAFLSGFVPLACQMNPSKARLASVIGAGMLIGAALGVVLPEGIHVWYDAAGSLASHGHGHSHEHLATPSATATAAAAAAAAAAPHSALGAPHFGGRDGDGDRPAGDVDAFEGGVSGGEHGEHSGGGHSHAADEWLIGFALACGFIGQLLIDNCFGGAAHGHSHGAVHASQPSAVADTECGESKPAVAASNAKSMSAMLGLLVHSGVDGIALGSAAAAQSGSLSAVVFVAIMLHKAPAAFGLATYLLSQGLPRQQGTGLLFRAVYARGVVLAAAL